MGALGHYLEDEGIATTQVSLIRLHTEKMSPPRALWVPFELGRPLGAPGDPAFQKRVLLAALDLLEARAGPLLVDFPEEAPVSEDMEGWACPIPLAPPAEAAAADLPSRLQREIILLLPWYDLARQRRGRTTVGLSGLAPEEVGRFISSYLGGSPAERPKPDMPESENLRYACEDLKAFYLEAVTAQPGEASGRRLADWFWAETVAGEALLALRAVCAASEDDAMRLFGSRLLVPGAQAHRS